MSSPLDPLTMTTIANYGRGAWDNVSQNNPFWSQLKAKGNIEYNVGGVNVIQPIEAGRYAPVISSPEMDVWDQYVPRARHTRWTAEWGELFVGTQLNRGMLRRNSGDQALVKLRETEAPAMARDILYGANNSLGHQLLQMNATKVAASVTGDPIYGLPTLLPGGGYTGAAAYAIATAITDYDLEGYTPPTSSGNGTLTGSAPADTDKEVAIGNAPSVQNYMGLSLKQGALTGVDGLEFDAWSPTLVNTSYTSWTGTADDESNAIEKFLQYGVFRAQRFSGSDKTKTPTLGLLDRTFYEYLGAKKASRETIFVTPDKKGVQLPDSGYGATGMYHAGILFMWDENMPAETAYILNMNQAFAKVQPIYGSAYGGNPPFKTTGGEDDGIIEVDTDWDPGTRAWILGMTIPMQVMFNPRYQVRCSNYS